MVDMKNELALWQFIADRLSEQQESVMLLVVAESSGSSPGRPGFKMAVTRDKLLGSVGGGEMEVRLVDLGKERLENEIDDPLLKPQIHRKNSPYASGMICSGEQSVILRRLDLHDLGTVNEIASALKDCQPITIRISNSTFQIIEEKLGDPKFCFEPQNESEFLFEEKLGYANKLFVVGAGHCALALTELASKMDFHVSLFDDRPDLNTLAKNSFAHEIHIIESYEKIGEYILSGENHYVVVMTLGYKFDEIVIRALFDRDFKYFGVLGSKAKMAALLGDLHREGFDKIRLDNIHTPIGLEINSQTPEEIAVSIAAEIIAVKNTKG